MICLYDVDVQIRRITQEEENKLQMFEWHFEGFSLQLPFELRGASGSPQLLRADGQS